MSIAVPPPTPSSSQEGSDGAGNGHALSIPASRPFNVLQLPESGQPAAEVCSRDIQAKSNSKLPGSSDFAAAEDAEDAAGAVKAKPWKPQA